ncbi:unnamed protein product, partial [Closterium sp. Naga37s-1]
DHFLSLDPTSLTVDLLEEHLLAAETSAVAVGSARGTPRTPFFEGCSPSPLAPSYASAAAADVPSAEDVGAAFASAKHRSSKGGRGGGAGSGSGGGGSSGGSGGGGGGGGGGEGSGGEGGGGSGGGSGGSGGGSGGSGGSGGGGTGGGRTGAWRGDIAAAALGASESGTLPGTAPAEALHTFTPDSGALRCFFRDSTTLTPLPAPVPVSASPPALACPALPSLRRGAAARSSSLLLVSPDDCSPADSPHGRLSERFRADLPVLRLHSDRGGEFSSDLLRDFCRGEGILQSFTNPDSPQKNGIAEHRIGLVMEVTRTSMIHAAAPHFLWPFALRYAAHQLNLWPRVSPETSPTLRWTGKVGDASVFRVWGSHAFVRDTSADKLSARTISFVFLGFVPDALGWKFYYPTLRRVLPSQDVTFDESVPFYRLFPYRSAPLPPSPLFLAPGPPPVDPLPPQGPAPSGVSQVDPAPGAVPAWEC